jgi:hypothetical protein
MGAVQAQEFGVAKWSLAQRSPGQIISADLDRALAQGRILRTHALRVRLGAARRPEPCASPPQCINPGRASDRVLANGSRRRGGLGRSSPDATARYRHPKHTRRGGFAIRPLSAATRAARDAAASLPRFRVTQTRAALWLRRLLTVIHTTFFPVSLENHQLPGVKVA